MKTPQERKNIFFSFYDQLTPEHAEKARANYDADKYSQMADAHENAIWWGFCWADTLEGFDYWSDIHDGLCSGTYPLQMTPQERKNIFFSFYDQLLPKQAEKAKEYYDPEWESAVIPDTHAEAVEYGFCWQGDIPWSDVVADLNAKTYPLQMTPSSCKASAMERLKNGKMPAHAWFKYLNAEHIEAAMKLENDMGVEGELFESLADALYSKNWGDFDVNWPKVHGQLVNGTYHTPESKERMATPEDREEMEEIFKNRDFSSAKEEAIFPEDDSERQKYAVGTFICEFFPHAIAELAKFSYDMQQKHNPDAPMGWEKGKSVGDGNQIFRHQMDGEFREVAWRGLEQLERFLTKMEPFNEKT